MMIWEKVSPHFREKCFVLSYLKAHATKHEKSLPKSMTWLTVVWINFAKGRVVWWCKDTVTACACLPFHPAFSVRIGVFFCKHKGIRSTHMHPLYDIIFLCSLSDTHKSQVFFYPQKKQNSCRKSNAERCEAQTYSGLNRLGSSHCYHD